MWSDSSPCKIVCLSSLRIYSSFKAKSSRSVCDVVSHIWEKKIFCLCLLLFSLLNIYIHIYILLNIQKNKKKPLLQRRNNDIQYLHRSFAGLLFNCESVHRFCADFIICYLPSCTFILGWIGKKKERERPTFCVHMWKNLQKKA